MITRDSVEDEARKVFEEMMVDQEVPEEDWDFLFEGFLTQYVEDANWALAFGSFW